MERIVITFNVDGTFRGASAQDFNGLPMPVDQAELATQLPDLNSAFLARVAWLEAQLATAPTSEQLAAKEAEIASLHEQLEAALNPPQPEMLVVLGEAFDALIPAEFKARFVNVFVNVRMCLEAGRPDLARLAIEAEPVPPELEAVKAQFLAFFDTP